MKVRAKLTLRNEVAIAAREKHKLSQARMAELADIPLKSLIDIEFMRFKKVKLESIEKLAQLIGVTADELSPAELRSTDVVNSVSIIQTVSSDALLEIHQPLLLQDIDRPMVNEELKKVISKALGSLPFKDAAVLKMRFGIDCEERTVGEIADVLKISEPRVRQMEERALRKMRHPLRSRPIQIVVDGESK